MKLKENAKMGFNIEFVHVCTKSSSSKLLLDTASLFAAPSLSCAGEKKFLSMFTHAGNARETTETPECLTAIYLIIETVGGTVVLPNHW